MSFDPMVEGDEELAAAAREDLVERFGRWLELHVEHREADSWDADLLLQWKWGYGDGDYGLWTRNDVDEFLTEHLPRKLSASPEDVATIPGSVAAFAHFLHDEGLLDPDGDPAEAVAARALAQQRAFVDAMADPSNFGMAKRLFGSFGLHDLPDAAELEAAMDGFNALPFEERGRILGLDDVVPPETDVDLPTLPLRDLPSTDEIEALAADVVLLRQVDAFHEALGPEGVKLTKAGNLTLADARRMVAATGVDDRVEGIRSSVDLPRLFAVGEVALQAGATQVAGNRLVGVDTWGKVPAGERWQRVATAAYEVGFATLAFGASIPSSLHLAELADAAALHFVAMLWIADAPVPAQALQEILEAAAMADGIGAQLIGITDTGHFTSVCGARRDDVLDWLRTAGVTTEDEDDAIILTPAGARLSVPALREMGFGVVVADEVPDLDADGLVDLVLSSGPDEVGALHALWTTGRDAATTARDLVAALVARPEPARVMVGFSILELFGPDAVDPVRSALDGPLAGHAWLFLATVGAVAPEDVPRDVVTSVAIDAFLATADGGTPADVVELVLGSIPVGEHTDFVDELSRSDHERTGELLDLLARHHPDAHVGRHARKALHRWHSRRGRPKPVRALGSLPGARESTAGIQPRGRRPKKKGRRRPR